MYAVKVLHGAGEKSSRATGRVAYTLGRLRIDQLDHGVDDMARGTELAVHASSCELAAQVLRDSAFYVSSGVRPLVHHVYSASPYRFWFCFALGILRLFTDV